MLPVQKNIGKQNLSSKDLCPKIWGTKKFGTKDLGSKKIWSKSVLFKEMWSTKIKFPNVMAYVLLIWINVTRTNVAWRNVTVTVEICSRCYQEPTLKMSSKSGQ